MVSFISHHARTGYAETRKEILAIVEEIISLKGSTATHVSNGWWEIFRRRHPELAIRTVEKLSYAHSVATDATIINHNFDLSEKALTIMKYWTLHKFLTVMRQVYHLNTLHHLSLE